MINIVFCVPRSYSNNVGGGSYVLFVDNTEEHVRCERLLNRSVLFFAAACPVDLLLLGKTTGPDVRELSG